MLEVPGSIPRGVTVERFNLCSLGMKNHLYSNNIPNIKAYDTGSWAHINVKLLHFFQMQILIRVINTPAQ